MMQTTQYGRKALNNQTFFILKHNNKVFFNMTHDAQLKTQIHTTPGAQIFLAQHTPVTRIVWTIQVKSHDGHIISETDYPVDL